MTMIISTEIKDAFDRLTVELAHETYCEDGDWDGQSWCNTSSCDDITLEKFLSFVKKYESLQSFTEDEIFHHIYGVYRLSDNRVEINIEEAREAGFDDDVYGYQY